MPRFDGQNHFHWEMKNTVRIQCWMGDTENHREAESLLVGVVVSPYHTCHTLQLLSNIAQQ